MLERIAGNEELKSSIRRMLEGRRLTHSVLLVGEAGYQRASGNPLLWLGKSKEQPS